MPRLSAVADYWSLTKPDVNLLIGITTAAGFWLGRISREDAVDWSALGRTVGATLLVAGGAGALNQFTERRFDVLMRRTARRPVAAGRIAPWRALVLGLLLSAAGTTYLARAVNPLASAIAFATLAIYLGIYTPLKRRTWLCVLVGALPGAAPPLIGWAAATGSLSADAWALYAILFLWQFPHVMAIAWMYRSDYDRAGYAVLPADHDGVVMTWQTMAPAILLLLFSVVPVLAGRAGPRYLVAALALGAWFVYRADRLAAQRSNVMARRLLVASIVYLPLLLASLIADRM